MNLQKSATELRTAFEKRLSRSFGKAFPFLQESSDALAEEMLHLIDPLTAACPNQDATVTLSTHLLAHLKEMERLAELLSIAETINAS